MDQWKVLSIGSVLVVWDIATSEQLVLVNFDEMFIDNYLLITVRVIYGHIDIGDEGWSQNLLTTI